MNPTIIIILLSVGVFALAMILLAMGTVIANKSIHGSCGGCANCLCKGDKHE